jgi:hypothetical protein
MCGFTWFWTGALDMIGDGGLSCLLGIGVIVRMIRMKMFVG